MPGEETSSTYSSEIGSEASKHLGQRTRQLGAILDVHLAVGPFGEDLQRLALAPHQPQANQAIALRLHRRDEQGLRENWCRSGRCSSELKTFPPRRSLTTVTQQFYVVGNERVFTLSFTGNKGCVVKSPVLATSASKAFVDRYGRCTPRTHNVISRALGPVGDAWPGARARRLCWSHRRRWARLRFSPGTERSSPGAADPRPTISGANGPLLTTAFLVSTPLVVAYFALAVRLARVPFGEYMALQLAEMARHRSPGSARSRPCWWLRASAQRSADKRRPSS